MTFGGQQKDFWWMITDDCDIHIKRMFKSGDSKKERVTKITCEELNLLDSYMSDGGRKSLANNVKKQVDGTEKPGIGSFLFQELGWSNTDAQLSGHLGVIFHHAGVWGYNAQKRNIKHWKISDGWYQMIKKYHKNHLPL
ncbi:hypothetical protein [Methanococcoides sp.]|uniref:hypothetical protein n=1 Tax=Methanococcoides sp. TaxID=1966350 RepID=UPI00272ED250|nr:hypothetical protein [Methanococcoides sp.]